MRFPYGILGIYGNRGGYLGRQWGRLCRPAVAGIEPSRTGRTGTPGDFLQWFFAFAARNVDPPFAEEFQNQSASWRRQRQNQVLR